MSLSQYTADQIESRVTDSFLQGPCRQRGPSGLRGGLRRTQPAQRTSPCSPLAGGGHVGMSAHAVMVFQGVRNRDLHMIISRCLRMMNGVNFERQCRPKKASKGRQFDISGLALLGAYFNTWILRKRNSLPEGSLKDKPTVYAVREQGKSQSVCSTVRRWD